VKALPCVVSIIIFPDGIAWARGVGRLLRPEDLLPEEQPAFPDRLAPQGCLPRDEEGLGGSKHQETPAVPCPLALSPGGPRIPGEDVSPAVLNGPPLPIPTLRGSGGSERGSP